MFRYKNTTLYNLMKINYVYVIHYVDHLFVIRHCDEADELLAILCDVTTTKKTSIEKHTVSCIQCQFYLFRCIFTIPTRTVRISPQL